VLFRSGRKVFLTHFLRRRPPPLSLSSSSATF
jgi:hypothetical protein